MFTMQHSKGQCICISLIIDIHNGGTITGNCLLLNGCAERKVIIAASDPGSVRRCAGGACLLFRSRIGVSIIVRIFFPVNNKVFGFFICGPACCQCSRRRYCRDLVIAFVKPSCKAIARAARHGQCDRFAPLDKPRSHIIAAIGIEANPIALNNHRVDTCRPLAEHNAFSRVALGGAPAHNRFIGIQGGCHHIFSNAHIASSHGIALAALGGMYNGVAVLAHEQHIAEFRELCINPNGLAGNAADRSGNHFDMISCLIQPVPALEHSAILGGVAGYAEGFPILQVLGPVDQAFVIHIEFVDVNHRLRLTDVAFGNVIRADLAGLVKVVCRAVGSAGAHRLFRLCFNRLLIRQGFGVIQRSQAALTVRDIAILADLAILVRRILCAELRAGAGLLFRLRVLLAGCAGCAAIVRRGISVALRCRGILAALGNRGVFAAVLRRGISVALRCRGILAVLGNRGVFAAVLRWGISVALRCRGILAALGNRGVFAAVLRRGISVALRCRSRRRILRAFRCRCGLFLVFRRCSGFHSGCAGCALLCLHSLGGFRAAGCGLCEDAHGAQADQHANRQQHCDPSFHVYSPLLIIRNRFL